MNLTVGTLPPIPQASLERVATAWGEQVETAPDDGDLLRRVCGLFARMIGTEDRATAVLLIETATRPVSADPAVAPGEVWELLGMLSDHLENLRRAEILGPEEVSWCGFPPSLRCACSCHSPYERVTPELCGDCHGNLLYGVEDACVQLLTAVAAVRGQLKVPALAVAR